MNTRNKVSLWDEAEPPSSNALAPADEGALATAIILFLWIAATVIFLLLLMPAGTVNADQVAPASEQSNMQACYGARPCSDSNLTADGVRH